MARSSSIRRLDPQLRDLIGKLRNEGRTLDEILAKLGELAGGGAPVSRSALGRYTQEIDRIGERMRRDRAIAEALVARFGEAPDDRLLRLNVELMHGVIARLAVAEDDGQAVTLEPRDAMFLADGVRKLAAAAKDDAAKTLAIQKAVTAELAKKAEAAVEKVAAVHGLSADAKAAIKAEFLGIA